MPDLILRCSCGTNWDMFNVAAVEERSSEGRCRVTVSSVSTVRGWEEGGFRNRYT